MISLMLELFWINGEPFNHACDTLNLKEIRTLKL